jgi:hypothetical protein
LLDIVTGEDDMKMQMRGLLFTREEAELLGAMGAVAMLVALLAALLT